MSRKKKINQLIENNNSNALFAFFDKLDATRRGAYFVLDYLVKNTKEIFSIDLSNALKVSTARMTKLLKSMEKKKLIFKTKSLHDARKIIISITEKGRATLMEFKQAMTNFLNSIIDEIGEDKFDEFINTSLNIQKTIDNKKEIPEP